MVPGFFIAIPAIAMTVLLAWALPYKVRVVIFKLPAWLVALIFAIFVRGTLKGVMGSYGVFITDLLLYPGMLFAKKRTEKQTQLIKEGVLDPKTLRRKKGRIEEWVQKRGNQTATAVTTLTL